MRLRFLGAALQELRDVTRHYSQIRDELGARFRAAVDSSLDRIEMWPLSGARSGRLTRMCLVKRFPYGVVYVARETEIVIVAVMHLHRRPGYWRHRLKGLGP